MSTESESAKAVAQALMASLEIEQELMQIISGRNNLRSLLQNILDDCEKFGSDDDDYEFGTSADVLSKIRQRAFDGLRTSFKVHK